MISEKWNQASVHETCKKNLFFRKDRYNSSAGGQLQIQNDGYCGCAQYTLVTHTQGCGANLA
jgi:hypothetical protein